MPEGRQKYALCQKLLQIKIVKDSIWYKKVSWRICLSPSLPPSSPSTRRKLGAPKIAISEILKCTKMAKLIHFRAECV